MIKKALVTVFCNLFFFGTSYAYFEFDNKLQLAYQSIINLQFTSASKLIREEIEEKPGNELVLLYQNYMDFLKAFISEDKFLFQKLKNETSVRIEKLSENESADLSPFRFYVLSEIHIQLALVKVKFGENVSAANEIRKAYKLIEKNKRQFPGFQLNRKITGFLHASLGAVPSHFQWLVQLAGMKGDITQGIDELESVFYEIDFTPYELYKPEVLFYLGNLYSSLNMNIDSVPLLEMLKKYSEVNPLIAYIYSNILSKHGKNDEALLVLDKTIRLQTGFPFTFLYYKRGLAKLRKLDLSAENDFNFFLTNYPGENNVKSSYQKLAWIALLKGDTLGYSKNMNYCSVKGVALLDEDKDAYSESLRKSPTNLYLLRSRLFFDGGYYHQSLKEITDRSIKDFPLYHEQLEVTYRLGRIMQMTGNEEKSISYFEMTLKNGMSSRYYYAANSALMLGVINENRKNYQTALNYFKLCLTIESDQYKNSIDQKANAGIERIKKILKHN